MRATVSVSVHVLVIAACWLAGVGVAVADAVSDRTFGALSHVFVAAGATLYLADRVERLAAGWLQAYQAGREVTRLRSSR